MKLHRSSTDSTAGRLLKGAVLGAILAFVAAAPARAQDAGKPLRYERVTESVKLRNVASRDGAIVSELSAGTLVAVYEERSGYLSVEVPGGMGVWIYGKYARETEVPDVIEITAQNINMRPLPSSDVSSFPLKEKLNRGDRVRMITRANPSRPLDSDWIKVWSPAGTRAWLPAGSSERLPAGEDGRLLWASAVAAASTARPASTSVVSTSGAATAPSKTVDASSPAASAAPAAKPGVSGTQAGGSMERAEALMADIRSGASKDFAGTRSAYQGVIQSAPGSVDAGLAKARLEELAMREDVVRLESDMRAFEERRREEVARAQAELAAAQKTKDPLWGRLQARGWLERETSAEGQASFVIRWAGRVTTEVVCTSGRYDLALFEGFEVGVTGVTTRAPIEAALGQKARPVRIDASRVEVITGRPNR